MPLCSMCGQDVQKVWNEEEKDSNLVAGYWNTKKKAICVLCSKSLLAEMHAKRMTPGEVGLKLAKAM